MVLDLERLTSCPPALLPRVSCTCIPIVAQVLDVTAAPVVYGSSASPLGSFNSRVLMPPTALLHNSTNRLLTGLFHSGLTAWITAGVQSVVTPDVIATLDRAVMLPRPSIRVVDIHEDDVDEDDPVIDSKQLVDAFKVLGVASVIIKRWRLEQLPHFSAALEEVLRLPIGSLAVVPHDLLVTGVCRRRKM